MNDAKLIQQILLESGYTPHDEPLRVVDLSFRFDSVLTGPNEQNTLVLVVQQDQPDIDSVHRRLIRLTRALDRVGSRRPITLVLIGLYSDPFKLERLNELARIITVTPDSKEDEVTKLLGPLLPLEIPQPVESLFDIREELYNRLKKKHQGVSLVNRLVKTSDDSEGAVEGLFIEELRSVVAQELEDLP